MSYIRKSNKNDQSPLKINTFRNPLKNRINQHFNDDLILNNINPFTEELTPWNGSIRLEASINLLKKQSQKTSPYKNQSQNVYLNVDDIVHDNVQYKNLAVHDKLIQVHELSINPYFCPKLKINSQHIFAMRPQKQSAKRVLLNKKSLDEDNRTVKKITNLTMQWDEDIVYNPEKKYIQEQSLKRKILSQFPKTRNQIRGQASKQQLKNEGKIYKLQIKNNKIHRKQISVFQFKKKENQSQLQKKKFEDEKEKEFCQFLSIQQANKSNQQLKQKKEATFHVRNHRTISPDIQRQMQEESGKKYTSDKWKFRTSLKTKRYYKSPQKYINAGTSMQIYNKTHRQSLQLKSEKQILNKITLEFDKCRKEPKQKVAQIFTKTSPQFLKKAID